MGNLFASLSTLPLSVWYDAVGVVLGTVLGIVAILRRPLRWVGAAVLILTMAATVYLTYDAVVLAALVTLSPVFLALIIGFLLVARGYHNKTWDQLYASAEHPALPPTKEKPVRVKGKMEWHLRDRIRRNFAGEDLRTAGHVPAATMAAGPIPDPSETPIPTLETLANTRPTIPEPAPAIQSPLLSEAPTAVAGHSPGEVRGMLAETPGMWNERTLYQQVVNLALKFSSPDEVDVPLRQSTEMLAELAQSIVNYLADTAPEHLTTASLRLLDGPVNDAVDVENAPASNPDDSAAGAGLDGETPHESSPNGAGTSDASTIANNTPESQELPDGAAASASVDNVVNDAVGLLGQRLSEAVSAFGYELRMGLSAASKGGN